MKKRCIVILALLLAVLCAVQTPLCVFAESKPRFISDMIMLTVTDGSAETAKGKLTGEYAGYQLMKDPIYAGDGCSTFIAYKITTDPDQAITDVQAMHMNGGYSYDEYRSYIEKMQKLSANLVGNLIVAVNEARTNYQKAIAKEKTSDEEETLSGAEYAYNVLSTFYDDNSGKTVAELFFEGEKFGLTTEASKAKEAQLVTIVMQGNLTLVEAIEKCLAVACSDGTANSFLELLPEMEVSSVETHAYDDQIADLIATLEYVQVPVQTYLNFNKSVKFNPSSRTQQKEIDLQKEKMDEMIEEYPDMLPIDIKKAVRSERRNTSAGSVLWEFDQKYDALNEEQKEQYQLGQMFSEALLDCEYPLEEYDTLYDLVMENQIRITTVEGEDGIGQTVTGMDQYDPADFVPLMMALTPGQRALAKIGFSELLLSVLVPVETYVSAFKNAGALYKPQGTVTGQGESTEDEAPEGTISVYAGVDRTLFDPDGIAMTSDAINRRNNGDESFGKVNMTAQQIQMMKYIAAGVGGAAVVMTTTIVVETIVSSISASAAAAAAAAASEGAASATYLSLHATFLGLRENLSTILSAVNTLVKTAQATGAEVVPGAIATALESKTLLLEEAEQAFNSFVMNIDAMFDAAVESAANTAANTAAQTGFRSALTRVCSQIFTKVIAALTIIAIIVMVIDIVMMLIKIITEDKTDTPYVEIPRVLCSVETIFTGYDDNLQRVRGPGYVYYYGVKNPEIDRGDVNDKSNPYRFGIGDVYNWTLKGPYREWLAIYTTKDQRIGNPIKADSLFVSQNFNEKNCRTLANFHSSVNECDFMFFYRQTKGDQSLGYKYVHYQTMSDDEMKVFENASATGSILANGASWAFGGVGLIAGIAGGIGLKSVADRKKKKTGATA